MNQTNTITNTTTMMNNSDLNTTSNSEPMVNQTNNNNLTPITTSVANDTSGKTNLQAKTEETQDAMQGLNNQNGDAKSSSNVMSYGISLTTRPIGSYTTRIGANSSKPSQMEVLKEVPWNLRSMLERFSFVNTYPVLTAQSSHTIIASLRIPQDLLVNDLVATPFNNFMYWRGDVEIRAQITGTPFHQGMLAGIFVPLSTEVQSGAIIRAPFSVSTINPTVYLFPNANTNAVMHIPFNSPRTYLDLTTIFGTENALGYFFITVFNPIQLAAGASDTVSVSIFSRFLNSEFKVPRRSAPTLFGFPESTDTVRDTIDAVGSVVSMASKVLPEVIQGLTDLGVSLDAPLDPRRESCTPRYSDTANFMNGVSHIDKLVLKPSQLYQSHNMTYGTTNNEMSMNYLKKRFTYLGSFDVDTTQMPGTIVAAIPMNPIPNDILLNARNYVPLLSYLSFPFTFWRGGITYKIQVVATSLQTLKLFAAFSFGKYARESTVPLNLVTSQYGEAFEINQGTNEIEFTVPFVSASPYKYVPTGNTYQEFNSLGYLNFVVLNRLVAPSNTPTKITLNVHIAGAEDFELSNLSVTNNVLAGIPQSSEVGAPLRVLTTNVEQAEDKLVAPPSNACLRFPNTSVMPMSVQELLKKYQYIGKFTPSTIDGFSVYTILLNDVFNLTSYAPLPAVPPTPQPTRQGAGLLQHFASIYRQFKGPLRFKIYDASSDAIRTDSLHVYFIPPTGTTDPATLLSTLVSNLPHGYPSSGAPFVAEAAYNPNCLRLPVTFTGAATMRCLEFEIPFSSIYNSHILTGAHLDGSLSGGLGALFFHSTRDTPHEYHIMVAFGDETTLGTPFVTPYILPQVTSRSGAYIPMPGETYTLTSTNVNTLYII